jgi:hypothetical protein
MFSREKDYRRCSDAPQQHLEVILGTSWKSCILHLKISGASIDRRRMRRPINELNPNFKILEHRSCFYVVRTAFVEHNPRSSQCGLAKSSCSIG